MQARAVACKIRERLFAHNSEVREQLRKTFINSEDYKKQRKEVYEGVMAIYQAGLKVNLKFGVSVTGSYSTHHIEGLEGVDKVTDSLCEKLISRYLQEADKTKSVPSEDTLVTDLIFESLTSEGIEELMDKFIELYV